MKQAALLARPIYIGQAQGKEKKHIKGGAKIEPGASLCSLYLLGLLTLMRQECIFLCLPNKRAVTLVHSSLQIFAVVRQNWGNYTLPQHLWCLDSDLTWLKQPRLGPHRVEAKHSRSPTRWNLRWWKLDVKKTQRRGRDTKPSMLESGTAKTISAESSRGSVSDSRRPPIGVGSPHPYGWKDIWLKNLNSFSFSFLVSLNPLRTCKWK